MGGSSQPAVTDPRRPVEIVSPSANDSYFPMNSLEIVVSNFVEIKRGGVFLHRYTKFYFMQC
jgi:hypothetical protein